MLSGVIRNTSLVYSPAFSKATGNQIYIKPENMQVTGAYKIRGAYYKISTLSDEEKARGLVTASAGNHAQGVAYAAQAAGVSATIVMPTTTPLVKVNNTKDYGAKVVLHGETFDDAAELAAKLSEVFHESGTLVSGIIGGLYSSTATISVLARKSRKASEQEATDYVAAMLLAVSMMFLRFMILILIFSREIFLSIYPYLLTMAVVAAIVAWFIHSRQKRPEDQSAETEEDDSSNPLEFKVALIFAVLFVIFTFLTHYTLVYAGTGGLNLLSFVSGFSDITPFILNLLQNTGSVAALIITACSMQAIISNIMVNMFYALFFAGKGSKLRPWILGGFGVVIACNLVLLLFFYI